jgi:hypothetical protein
MGKDIANHQDTIALPRNTKEYRNPFVYFVSWWFDYFLKTGWHFSYLIVAKPGM